MRFSFAIALAVAATLASSISATPIEDSAQKCAFFCWIDVNCEHCTWGLCISPRYIVDQDDDCASADRVWTFGWGRRGWIFWDRDVFVSGSFKRWIHTKLPEDTLLAL
ncbi:uncharacterized protein F5147DRAFT_647047 [Suillus discolor]|uniref:Uncharacterized protein n=1 Tax=Suillus discolor TaxID=1912936 RepID=A0A9P7K0D4_9AGAM|nr:uncharacterized protein F5147DRAFT_647047 [Suillus discolor]KAG2120572.1 hypothetical protein F5147DRAFT_647047 [Suillus discolor]